MITSEGDAVVSFKVRGNVDLFFGVPQKNNPQSMSTGLGLPDVSNDSYKIDVWEQSSSGAFEGDPVSYENGTDKQAEIQDTEWKSRLKISLTGESTETRYIYVRGGYGSDGERKLCFPEVNFTKFANNSFLNPHRTIIVNKNPETGNLSFTTDDDPTGFDLRETHNLKLVSGNDYKFRKATDTFDFKIGTKTLSHESDSVVTASTMPVPYNLDSGASLGQFAVDTLDSEFDPTLSNFWDMKTVNFMASPNLKDTYTYDNIYKIEINDNFIIHGKGDFAYRKNLYNIAGYETTVVKKPTSNSLLFTFAGCLNLTNSDIVENLDVSDVTSMNGAFMNTLKLDVTLWQWQSLNNNTGLANLTSARRMFYGSGFNRSLGTWKPVALKNAERMFSYSKFNQETITTWALNLTTALNNVSHMFSFSRMNQIMNDFDAIINGCEGVDTMFLYSDMQKSNLPNNVLLESTLEDVSTTFNFDSATIQLSSTGSPSVTLTNLTFNSQGFLPGWMDLNSPGGGFQVVIAKQSDKNTAKQRYFADANVLGFSTGGYINEDTKSLFNSWTDLNKVENTDNITFTGFANLNEVELKEESFLNWQNDELLEIGFLFEKSEGLNIVPFGDVKINNVTVKLAPTPTPTVTHTNTFDDFRFVVEGVNIVDTLTITTDNDDVSADLSEINPLFNSNTLQHIHVKELDEKHIARVRFDGVASLNSTDKWKYKIKFANGTVMSEWQLVENGSTQSLSQGDRVFLYLDYSDVKKNSEFQFKFNVEKQKIGENSWQSGGDGLGRVEVKYNVVYNPPTPTPTPTATKSKTPTKTPTKTQESVDFNAIASQMQNSTDKKDDYSDVTGTIVHVDLVNGFYAIELNDTGEMIVTVVPVNLQSELENNVGKTILFSGFSDNNFVDLFMLGTAVFIENHRIIEPVGTGFDFMGLEALITTSDTETELPTILSVTSFDANKLTAKYNSNHDLTIDLKIVRENYSGRPADTTESDVFGQLTTNDIVDGSGWSLIRGFDDRFGMFQDNVGGLHNLIRAINAGSLSDYNPLNNEAEFNFFSQNGEDYSTFLNGSNGIKLAIVLKKWDNSLGMETILEEHFVEVTIVEGPANPDNGVINLSEILLKDNVEFRASFGSISDDSPADGELYLENLRIDFDKVSESFKENWDLNNYDLYYMVVDSTLDNSITDEIYDFFKDGVLIQNNDGIFAFGRSTFNSTSSDAKFTFQNNIDETIDDVFVEGENYVGTLLKLKNEMDNKVHANITDFIDNLSEDAEIRFVLVNNDDNFEGESRFISSAKYSMNLQAYYPQYIYVENVQFVQGEGLVPDGFGVFEVQPEKGNFHNNQTLRYYTSVFGSKNYAIRYETESSQWRFWDHPSFGTATPGLDITSNSLEFSDNNIKVSLEVPASAWNTPTPTRTKTKTPTRVMESPLNSNDLGYFVIGKFETHEGVEIATTGIYEYESSNLNGTEYVYTFKSNMDNHVLKVHYINHDGSSSSFFEKAYGGGDNQYNITLHTSESSSDDLIGSFVGSDTTGSINETKTLIRHSAMEGVLSMAYVGKNTKRHELHPTETNVIDYSDDYGWSLNSLPILSTDFVSINSGIYPVLHTHNGGDDAWVKLHNDIDMTLKTELYQGNPLGLGPSNYDEATDTFFGFLALAVNTFNSNTTFTFQKFLNGNKQTIGNITSGFVFRCSSEVPQGALDVELPEDLPTAPVSDSDLRMHLMGIQKDIVVGNGSPSEQKFIGGVFDIDDLSPSHISNENLVPISKMNIQDGVLNAFTSGDWQWWGKFDGANANIADKVYIIDMNSSSTDLLDLKPQLFNNESDFMNNKSNYSQ